jgi:hypothetical protein
MMKATEGEKEEQNVEIEHYGFSEGKTVLNQVRSYIFGIW